LLKQQVGEAISTTNGSQSKSTLKKMEWK